MKLSGTLAAILTCAAAFAQNRNAIAISDPSQPVTVRVKILLGSITVKAGAVNQVIVESTSSSRNRRAPGEPPPGMHRIGPATGLVIQEDHNIVTVSAGVSGWENLVIQTPVNANLQLNTTNGDHIDVSGVNGTLEIETVNASLHLQNISGSVVAHTVNGPITAVVDRPEPGKPMSFLSVNGKVDVTLPADTKALLRLRTNSGSVHTDFAINETAPHRGPINGGGPEYRFESMHGDIVVHKK